MQLDCRTLYCSLHPHSCLNYWNKDAGTSLFLVVESHSQMRETPAHPADSAPRPGQIILMPLLMVVTVGRPTRMNTQCVVDCVWTLTQIIMECLWVNLLAMDPSPTL